MSNFNEWWEGLSFSLKLYWTLAIPFTFFFLLQLVLTFLGGHADHHDSPSADHDVESDTGIPFQFFTLKNLVAFFAIFGWTGIACLDSGMPDWSSLLIAVIAGLATMTAMAYLLYLLSKTNVSGTMSFKNAIGQSGEVYIPIPATRKGTGKVSIKVQGSLRTLDAITDDTEDLQTGKIITVKNIVNEYILLVSAG